MIDPTQMAGLPMPPEQMAAPEQRFAPPPPPVTAAPLEPAPAPPKPQRDQKAEELFQRQVAREYDRLLHTVASGAAQEMGDPDDSVQLDKDDEAGRWNYRDPKITPDALPTLAQQALAEIQQQHQQKGKELPDPQQLTLLVAAKLTRIQTGGLRRELVSRGYPSPADQLKRAQTLARRFGMPASEQQQPVTGQEGAY